MGKSFFLFPLVNQKCGFLSSLLSGGRDSPPLLLRMPEGSPYEATPRSGPTLVHLSLACLGF